MELLEGMYDLHNKKNKKKMTNEEILNKILNVSNSELDLLDLSYIDENTPVIGNGTMYFEVDSGNLHHETTEYFYKNSGSEHYRLLTYISSLYNNEILFDVGTNYCLSALALAHNKNNKIKSYDIIDKINIDFKKEKLDLIDNLEFVIGDFTTDEYLKNCSFIFLDVDHDGSYENFSYSYLKEINWKGLLLLDDINLNIHMSKFWNNISEKKYELTNIGHWSGTGLVFFE